MELNKAQKEILNKMRNERKNIVVLKHKNMGYDFLTKKMLELLREYGYKSH